MAGRGQMKGLYDDGVWECNCSPRAPAVSLQVRKPGPNHGRYFYVCAKDRGDKGRCKFFLWDTEAKMREASSQSQGQPGGKGAVSCTGKSSEGQGRSERLEEGWEPLHWSESEDDEAAVRTLGLVTPRKEPRTASSPSSSRAAHEQRLSRATTQTTQPPTQKQTPAEPRPTDTQGQHTPPPRGGLTPPPSTHRASFASPPASNGGDDLLTLLCSARAHLPGAVYLRLRTAAVRGARLVAANRKARDGLREIVKAREGELEGLRARARALEEEVETVKCQREVFRQQSAEWKLLFAAGRDETHREDLHDKHSR